MPEKTRRLLLGAGIASLLALAGCGSGGSGASSAKKPRIGFAMTLNDPYWQNMRLGAIDEAQKLGAEVTILNAEEDVPKQAQQIQELIAQSVDIVCLVPMKPDGLVTSVTALNANKIPVIIVNREIGDGCEYVAYTGTDTYMGGLASAKILMQAIGGKGEIIEFQQVLGTGPQLMRTKALDDTLKQFPDVKVIGRYPHEGNDAKVVATLGTILPDHPNLKGIYVHGDPQAIAAGNACAQAGRKDIAIVGMGGSQQALDAIKDGKITGTSFQRPEEEGRSAIRLAMRHLKGEKLEKRYPIDCPAVTKENVSQFKGQF
ncbi:MAG TPA: sugar ABC transporter substrate-binding protein [Planctomycetota bacterium]|jgi:ABC-type sugar transport system substrate-binding protein